MSEQRWWHTWGRVTDDHALTLTLGPTPFGPDDRLDTGEVVREIRTLPEFRVNEEMAYLGSLDHEPDDAESDAYAKQAEALAKNHG